MEKIPMTPEGYEKMEAELKKLKSVERPNIIEAISSARELGDFKENAEYHSAKEKQAFIEGRIQELESYISRAEIIDPSKLSGDTVRFGATVKLMDEETENETTYKIVGQYESDIKNGRLANNTPIAKALMGKKQGDFVEVKTPKGEKNFEILKVTYK